MLLAIMTNRFGHGQPDRRGAGPRKTMEQTVLDIQSGDESLRNGLIAECQKVVAVSAGKYCGKYIEPSQDDEFTIALSAFSEAIDRYKPNSEQAFLEFADTLIGHRLAEYMNRSGRVLQPGFKALDPEAYEKPFGQKERQSELRDLNEVLEQFGISFTDLAEESPRDAETRRMVYAAGHAMADDADLMRRLLKNRKLPVKELLGKVRMPRRELERYSRFITMTAILYNGPFPHLRDYWQMDAAAPRERRERDV